MLSVTQVRAHSELFSRAMLIQARLLYVHNGRASRLGIICPLSEKGDVGDDVDWGRFTDWVNRHDDLTEDNLVVRDVWLSVRAKCAMAGKYGRNGALDTTSGRVLDFNSGSPVLNTMFEGDWFTGDL